MFGFIFRLLLKTSWYNAYSSKITLRVEQRKSLQSEYKQTTCYELINVQMSLLGTKQTTLLTLFYLLAVNKIPTFPRHIHILYLL